MNSSKNQTRAVVIVFAIIALVFVNIGIFYTRRITNQADITTTNTTTDTVSTTKLDETSLSKISNRVSVNVDDQLQPYSDGRSDPFTKP